MPAVLVPAAAVRTVSGTSRVFVVAGDHAEERIVTTGQKIEALVEITTGLKSGERVATENVTQLVDGERSRCSQCSGLLRLCVKRPVFATVLILSLTVVGVFAFTRLGVDRYPKVDLPTILITTVQPGAAPEQIETEITDKIEEAVNTISGIDELRSSSSEGVSQVIITFLLDKDIDVAAQEVRDKVNGVLPQLPKTIQQPRVDRMDPDAAPVLSLALTAEQAGPRHHRIRRQGAPSTAREPERRRPGARDRRPRTADQHPARRRSPARVQRDGHRRRPRAQQPERRDSRRAHGSGPRLDHAADARPRPDRSQEFGDIVVKASQAHPVKIADVADVEDGMADADTVANIDGTSTVLLNIRRQSGTNTVEVVNGVKEQLKAISRALPSRLQPAHRPRRRPSSSKRRSTTWKNISSSARCSRRSSCCCS